MSRDAMNRLDRIQALEAENVRLRSCLREIYAAAVGETDQEYGSIARMASEALKPPAKKEPA
jgi:hypothetical protein